MWEHIIRGNSGFGSLCCGDTYRQSSVIFLQRAVSVLQNADLIAAEDTRHSQRLLQHYAIATRVMAYHDHSDDSALSKISACLAAGGSVALVSDAGTPLISDPGYRLVRAMQDQGFSVRPVPGACAAVAALSASGLATDRFLFEGFLPAGQEPGTIDSPA